MRDLGNGMRVFVVLCAAGPVASFIPYFSPGRARTGRNVGVSCEQGSCLRRGASRAPMSPSSLHAVDRQEGHLLPEEPQADAGLDEPKSAIRSRWSKGQGSWSRAPKDATSGDMERNGMGGGEDAGAGPAIAAVSQEVEGATGVDQDTTFAELPAGGQEEEGEGVPKPNLTKKRLKKFFLKDFAGSSWTVGIQWKKRPGKIVTTKVALKEDGTVIWLDKGKGNWKLRTKSRDLVFYRDYFLNWNGKRIYAAKLLDNTCDMYIEGDIKGWGPFMSLNTLGSFQAVRRGIPVDENTPRPPWESRPPLPVEVEDGKPPPKTEEIFLDVDLE